MEAWRINHNKNASVNHSLVKSLERNKSWQKDGQDLPTPETVFGIRKFTP